jgi:hypothetical protein
VAEDFALLAQSAVAVLPLILNGTNSWLINSDVRGSLALVDRHKLSCLHARLVYPPF